MVGFREVFYVDVEKINAEIQERLGLLAKIRSSVDKAEDGSSLIKGTRIEAHRVAALASTSLDEAKFEYPSLSQEQIELASQYASIYPKPGRPYPTQSLKRMLLSAEFDELNAIVAKGRKEGTIYGQDAPKPTKEPGKRVKKASLGKAKN